METHRQVVLLCQVEVKLEGIDLVSSNWPLELAEIKSAFADRHDLSCLYLFLDQFVHLLEVILKCLLSSLRSKGLNTIEIFCLKYLDLLICLVRIKG